MTENITLPRELAEKALEALEHFKLVFGGYSEEVKALRTALAAEPTKPEPVAWVQKWAIDRLTGQMGAVSGPVTWGIDAPLFTCAVHHSVPLYTAPPEDEALRRDAERYRWMTEDHPEHETRRRVYSVTLLFNAHRKEHIDAAIDAAMQEDKT